MSFKKKKKHDDNFYPDISGVASASETTGLMPTIPSDDEEYASYEDLSCIAIPKKKKDNKE